jgi:hypothetical protein
MLPVALSACFYGGLPYPGVSTVSSHSNAAFCDEQVDTGRCDQGKQLREKPSPRG